MMLTRVKDLSAGGVTSVQLAPPSRDRWIRPSSDPAHSSPAATGDSASAKTVPYHSVPVMSLSRRRRPSEKFRQTNQALPRWPRVGKGERGTRRCRSSRSGHRADGMARPLGPVVSAITGAIHAVFRIGAKGVAHRRDVYDVGIVRARTFCQVAPAFSVFQTPPSTAPK